MYYIFIKIVYALPKKQYIIDIKIKNGKNLNYLLKKYDIFKIIPKVEIKNNIGIYGKIINLNYILKNGDRIEIYRNLLQDPRKILRERAKKIKKYKNKI